MKSDPDTGNLDRDWLAPLFLGSYAENDELFEKMLVEFVRDHMYWRRNVHPEDRPTISIMSQHSDEYRRFVGRMKSELHTLTACLKNSVPFFSPRYIGHMASDLLLPGLVAQLVTTLYNPNHVTDESAMATIDMELEVGIQLAAMVGFPAQTAAATCAWGHLTSGGTIANDEALWYFRSVRYWPLAAAAGLKAASVPVAELANGLRKLVEADEASLFALSIGEVVELRQTLLEWLNQGCERPRARLISARIEASRVEAMGMAAFHAERPHWPVPRVLVPATAHYSWEKALKLLGMGTAQLEYVPVDDRMRMDPDALDQLLSNHHETGVPVLAAIGVLGTTEYGSIDPIDALVECRQRWYREGMAFAVHVDAAWGGYLASLFRSNCGQLLARDEVGDGFRYFPSESVYRAFAALSEVDSITIDPHKLGFLPFGCGAYIARDRRMTDFVGTRADYVFDEAAADEQPFERRFRNLGRYIIEGSKPGAAAAAACITHRVLPLDTDGFGRLCGETIRNCEYFFERVGQLGDELDGQARLVVPFEPDCNLICLAINPEGNRSAARMNRFGEALYVNLRAGKDESIHSRDYFGSRTRVPRAILSANVAKSLTDQLGLDALSFVVDADESKGQADRLFLLRHTLMNPWLRGRDQGKNHIDGYLEYLAGLIRTLLD